MLVALTLLGVRGKTMFWIGDPRTGKSISGGSKDSRVRSRFRRVKTRDLEDPTGSDRKLGNCFKQRRRIENEILLGLKAFLFDLLTDAHPRVLADLVEDGGDAGIKLRAGTAAHLLLGCCKAEC